MHSNAKTVAIAFDLNFRHAAEIFRGASDYMAEAQLDWQLMPLNFGFEAQLMELARSGQLFGAIGTFVSDRWIQSLSELEVAAINIFHFSKINSVPTIGPDEYATGQAAAAHLHAQGARRFAFLGADGIHSTRLRADGFREGIKAQSCIELMPGPGLSEQLDQLSQPSDLVGIFCANDRIARELILLARNKGLHCGKDILVVGVDNDPSESVFAGIGISSFQQPIRATGYQAARTLHADRRHDTAHTRSHLLPVGQLIPRASSLSSNRARVAQAAANWINDNLADPDLDVEQLARRVGVSRRSLEIAVKEQFARSPYRVLAEARLKTAWELLQTTRLPIMEVGLRCGYPEAHHFSAWFKKESGQSPKTYREQTLKTPSGQAR